MTEPGTVLVHLEVSEPVPVEAAAGGEIVVRLRASCPVGRDRRGLPVHVIAPDEAQANYAFVTHDGAISETGDIVLNVPPRLGEHVWRFVLPAHEIAGGRCEEASLALAVQARPQTSSLAVWSVPSPVVAGDRFAVKIGAKSSAACELKGRAVEIRRDGKTVARGALGDTPWPGTAALYWTELELAAPAAEGLCTWTADFSADGLDLPHEGATSAFSVAIVRPSEHRLAVKVIEKDSGNPLEEALVRLGAYRAETGRTGCVELGMPKGRYELQIWKAGYDIKPVMLDLDRDVSVEVEALAVPEEDPDAIWKM
jgi:hypothetical protein